MEKTILKNCPNTGSEHTIKEIEKRFLGNANNLYIYDSQQIQVLKLQKNINSRRENNL